MAITPTLFTLTLLAYLDPKPKFCPTKGDLVSRYLFVFYSPHLSRTCLIGIHPHPENLKFPPRYKFSVFCGPLASLADFGLSISQSPENYTMSEVHHSHSLSSKNLNEQFLIIFRKFPLHPTTKNEYQNF